MVVIFRRIMLGDDIIGLVVNEEHEARNFKKMTGGNTTPVSPLYPSDNVSVKSLLERIHANYKVSMKSCIMHPLQCGTLLSTMSIRF